MVGGDEKNVGSLRAGSDPLAGLLGALRADVRLAGRRVVRPHPLLLVVGDDLGNEVHVLPSTAWENARDVLSPFEGDYAEGRALLVLLGEPSPRGLDEALAKGLAATLPADASIDHVFVAIHGAFELLASRQRSERRGEWVNRYRSEIGELVEIAQALTTERRIDRLLELILEKGRYVTGADAGSIYVVEGDEPEITSRTLRFMHTQNDSVSFDARDFRVPINERSMSGYVALHGTILNIHDVYDLPPGSPYAFDGTFDQAIGYRTRSMLCSPLLSRTGEVLGVLQLLNRKPKPTGRQAERGATGEQAIAFDAGSESLLATLASLAGVALENAFLAAENERMLEGFVRASVEAIEQRDPTTSGHSIRVARMSVGLAKAVERSGTPRFSSVRWSADDLRELEYASLLHDFGKIGVREEVLVKAKKLYPHELELVRARFAAAERSVEVERLVQKLEFAKANAAAEAFAELDAMYDARVRELAVSFDAVCHCNEPMVLHGGDFAAIEAISRCSFRDLHGEERPLLTPQELASLSVPRGSLTAAEFAEIRSHVVHTYGFLSAIPWGRKLRNVPRIAVAHHERLDGTGYPNGLVAHEIPLQSKIMSVSDIFDALTAADRPYKKAMPLERALDILAMEVRDGHIDEDLLRIFREAAVWTHLDASSV
jgi:HD-GYP domain-containing protein (c-di-GMP phosphodiesterase class II)